MKKLLLTMILFSALNMQAVQNDTTVNNVKTEQHVTNHESESQDRAFDNSKRHSTQSASSRRMTLLQLLFVSLCVSLC